MAQGTYFLIAIVISSAITYIYMLRLHHLERVLRIEHGLDEPNPSAQFSTVRMFGRLMISLAGGLLASYLVAQVVDLPSHILIPGLLLLSGGISLLYSARLDSQQL